MSGYLQRLAGSVMQPKETVHPFVGSVFSPELRLERERLPASDDTTIVPIPETRLEPAKPPVAGRTASPDRFAAPGQQPRAEAVDHMRSLPPPLISRGKAASSLQRIQHLNLTSDEAASLQPHSAVMREQGPQTAGVEREGGAPPVQETEPRESAYTPLLQAEAARHRRVALEEPLSLVPIRAHAKPRVNTSSRAEREPEEIQIHIGRIEVSAVATPAPAPTKVLRKALSLDDYLSRRDGRTR